MIKKMSRGALLGVAALGVWAGAFAKAPTCSHPVGKWQDQLKGVLEIRTYDASTGAIAGAYIDHTGSDSWPMVGWINSTPVGSSDACKGCKVDHTGVITFAVRWTNPNRVTAWTGTCGVNAQSGGEFVLVTWNTSRPNSEFEWDHTRTGAEPFVPVE